MTDEEIKDTVLYKDCYKRIKQFPELAGDLVYLLRDAFEHYLNNNPMDWRWDVELLRAFYWDSTPQRWYFWEQIRVGELPRGYE